jgi:hypothetical protein
MKDIEAFARDYYLSGKGTIIEDDICNPRFSKFEYNGLCAFYKGEISFHFSEVYRDLFTHLWNISVRSLKFDVEIKNYIFEGCFIKEVIGSCRIVIQYASFKIKEDYQISMGSFISLHGESSIAEDFMYNEIMKELDIWLTEPYKYLELKEKGLIKYV